MGALREARAGKIPLVVDANVLLAAIPRDSLTRRLLLKTTAEFHAPAALLEEVPRHLGASSALIAQTGIGEFRARRLFNLLLRFIRIHPSTDYQSQEDRSLTLAPHPEDAPYLALALTLGCPVWSNDRALAKQTHVRVLSTREILSLIGD